MPQPPGNPYRRMMTGSITAHLPTGTVIAPAHIAIADAAGTAGDLSGTLIAIVTPAAHFGQANIPIGTKIETRSPADRTKPRRTLTVTAAVDIPPNIHISCIDEATPAALY